jgi:hypothetical protein
LRRKKATTPITSRVAIRTVRSTSAREARMVMVRSIATSRLMSAGSTARRLGRSAFTRSTVVMMFAPGWRYTTITMAGRPL